MPDQKKPTTEEALRNVAKAYAAHDQMHPATRYWREFEASFEPEDAPLQSKHAESVQSAMRDAATGHVGADGDHDALDLAEYNRLHAKFGPK